MRERTSVGIPGCLVVTGLSFALLLSGCASERNAPDDGKTRTTVSGDRADERDDRCDVGADVDTGVGLPTVTRWAFVCRGGDRTASVAAADLNGDGTADVVVQGSPRQSTSKSPASYVLAIDGATGERLWQSRDTVAMITIARFGQVNDDAVLDVVVNGRGAPYDERPLVALDGRTGDRLWRVEASDPPWRNIYTPQPVGDVDGDGIGDWVISAGGDHLRQALDKPTVPGRIVMIGGADGSVLGSVDLPDGQETYASPVLFTDGQGTRSVIVGSGGEVFPGSLWRVELDAVLRGDGSKFHQLRSGEDRSAFIAPVSVADIDGDGRLEVVSVRTDGEVAAVDPDSGEVSWSTKVSATSPDQMEMDTVSVSVPAVGQLRR